jgi:hypothetical protein
MVIMLDISICLRYVIIGLITQNYGTDFTHLKMHIEPNVEISCRLCHIYPTLDGVLYRHSV